MLFRQESSDSRKLCQKRLAKERQTRFRKRQKINHERIMDERQKRVAKERLAKERQARLIKRQNIKKNNYPPEIQIPSGQEAYEAPDLRQKKLAKERQVQFRKSNNNERRISDELESILLHDLGQIDQICVHCGAKFWMEERDHSSNRASPTFSICCAHGKVLLPPLAEPPLYLLNLYTSSESDAISFRKNIRHYNSVLACTSFGANIDTFQGQGISNFCIHGQVYHQIGSLLPEEGHQPAFAQLYIYDSMHEIENRHNVIQELDKEILQNLLNMLDECNPYIKNFRHVRDLIQTNVSDDIFMVIYAD
ncbi:hypothetical protein RclHR1_01100036 [Rhizophagus clarus]|uniref:Helitron helicase-like domain-containing protein n=1 Tax=Rhizophagus clarus TaxID=94130 RepID=A0A2Z6QI04_9GLOM|nr:hypothetical protein RclHR1_01100036 [Rhizophagus clarus]GES85173.1 hypothetical protein GLOIN_2v1464680 [Rhizophagus clarus]